MNKYDAVAKTTLHGFRIVMQTLQRNIMTVFFLHLMFVFDMWRQVKGKIQIYEYIGNDVAEMTDDSVAQRRRG